jgi:hypothetical protein
MRPWAQQCVYDGWQPMPTSGGFGRMNGNKKGSPQAAFFFSVARRTPAVQAARSSR